MLDLNDTRWTQLEGGYRIPYDPRSVLNRLRNNDESAWDDLWQELHHQSDVGTASYAAIPVLVDIHRSRGVLAWQTYALCSTIELCRQFKDNPKLPKWLDAPYAAAWRELFTLGQQDLVRANDETNVRSILAAIAITKQLPEHAEMILNYAPDELRDFFRRSRAE